MAPGPPRATAVDTPTMLPVPIVAARVAERAANPLISPSDEGSDLTDRLTAFPICLDASQGDGKIYMGRKK